ncbi:4c36e3c8-b16b-44bb-bbbe-9cfadd504ef7 [Thermothielavioides terrestris]|uniref:4c36e3c8-b16b-44bb-bbbe-9cfadd504ef7 n=1 Tax=Thermothielavioides terrestris TaxID=2587410 RepID=A0A446BYJ4_9PEZI|nr:4c36e3c8-b16b-44bb-bbbe-9cfadd504ef7 [Thermothielavioides terrestris]
MAPIKPHWSQPSHPDIQDVIVNDAEFTTKSVSKIALPPFGLFAKLEFPPCTVAAEPTYATVQIGRDKHLDLNSDLLYINHSCEPSLIFDTANMVIIAGPKGLQPGDELTFFYPSTEWDMAQPFDCFCGAPTCRGRIAGARDMTRAQLDGMWLNGHIRELLEEREQAAAVAAAAAPAETAPAKQNGSATAAATLTNGAASPHTTKTAAAAPAVPAAPADDQTVRALREALSHAEKAVEAARLALASYVAAVKPATVAGAQRRGPTSRELSGEMGGDTSV